MAQLPMYAAMVNSPGTELAADINATATSIDVLDASKLPDAPNLVTVGSDETAETIRYTGKTGNTLTGCTRGFEGTAKGWAAGTQAARNHTAYDYEAGRANIADVSTRVDNIVIPDGTTTQKGILQLSDATNGTRDSVAATEKAVGLAFQAGVERKAEVVAALNSIGVTASTSEQWDSLIPKIAAVIRSTGTATVSQVLSGATFSNSTGNDRTGTMANNGAGGTVTPGTTNQTKAAGYYSSTITISGSANLLSANIKNGVNIFGVTGTLTEGVSYATGTATSTSAQVTITRPISGTTTARTITVSGLSFRPNRVIIRSALSGANSSAGTYTEVVSPDDGFQYASVASADGNTITMGRVGTLVTDVLYVTNTGFQLPVQSSTQNFVWEAFRV